MLNIVIPMAGLGSRFNSAGYLDPKPLIPIHGIPMIRVVIENLRPKTPHRFIFICQASHVQQYHLAEKLTDWAPGCVLIELNSLTEGAACSVLSARSWINNEDSLMIANSDQYVDVDINLYLEQMEADCLDGLIMTMKASDPKWSFVGLSNFGSVTRVVEKEVISDEATVGIYNFKHGRDFVCAAELMITQNMRVNGEFYVAPVYNQLIGENKKIGVYNVGSESNGMHGLGIPSDLTTFLEKDISLRVIESIEDAYT